MYMRKWQGPGHPFPLLFSQTLKSIDPEPLIQSHLFTLREMLEKMPVEIRTFLLTINTCSYLDNAIEKGNYPFKWYLEHVSKGKYCYRMASNIFVGTALHFIRILFNENIPGMTLSNPIDMIG